MQSIFAKTLGGLSPRYYVRHLLFGALFPLAYVVSGQMDSTRGAPALAVWTFLLANTVLYPYARFVYESVVDFIVGDNLFFTSAGILVFWKFLTMAVCWILATGIAPLGLAYLYLHHSRAEREAENAVVH